MFLEDVPMELSIIDGEKLVWSRHYKGVDYVYCHISLAMAYGLDKQGLHQYEKLLKKKINSQDNGIRFL